MTDHPLAMPADAIHWDLTAPCSDCPFRRDVPFHTGIAKSLPETLAMIDGGIFAHTCHKTDTRSACAGPVAGQTTGKPIQHCAGAILMLLKTGEGKDLQLPLLVAAQQGRFDLARMTALARDAANIFTLAEFVRFNLAEIRKLAGLPPEEPTDESAELPALPNESPRLDPRPGR